MWLPDPDDVAAAQLTAFAKLAGDRAGREFADYAALLAWSTDDVAGFWRCVWDYFDIIAESGSDTVLGNDTMPGAVWFPGARLNYVDQVFRDRPDDGVAVLELDETGAYRELTWAQLRQQVAAVAATLRELGVGVGDRVVGYLPEQRRGGRSRSSPPRASARSGRRAGMDYAPSAALGRFGQLEPVVLFAADGYRNGGKVYDRAEAVAQVRAGLPTPARDDRRRPARHARRARRAAVVRRSPRQRRPSSHRCRCRSTIRCGCCSRPGRPACPRASCTGTAACCSST